MRTAAVREDDAPTVGEPMMVREASKYASVSSTPPPDGRREYARRSSGELDWITTVRLRSGADVSLVDLSAGGLLFESSVPLRPGTTHSLEIIGRGIETVAPFQVLRAQITALRPDSARYRGAGRFTRPIELPDIHLPEAPDPLVGVDLALKRLVERAYAADASQRLVRGDAVLMLQALSRRAFSIGSDPFAGHIGGLVQDLMPAIKQGRGLAGALAAIERQLSLVIPDARIRMVDGPATPGSRSILVSLPGGGTAAAVSIDLPPTAILTDTQVRLLRTSSRLVALAHRFL